MRRKQQDEDRADGIAEGLFDARFSAQPMPRVMPKATVAPEALRRAAWLSFSEGQGIRSQQNNGKMGARAVSKEGRAGVEWVMGLGAAADISPVAGAARDAGAAQSVFDF